MIRRFCNSKSISLVLLSAFLFANVSAFAQDAGQMEKRLENLRQSRGSSVKPAVKPSQPSETVPLEGVIDRDEYIMGPGDELDVSIWGGEEYKSYSLTISAEGRLLVPPAGPIDVSGLSLADAEAKVQESLSKYFTSGQSSLTLLKPRTFRITIAGFVAAPGTYALRAVDRISDLLKEAGGVKSKGSIRRILMYDKDKTLLKTVDLTEYYNSGNREQNPSLLDGAIVEVPSIDNSVVLLGNFTAYNVKADSIPVANGEIELLPRKTIEFFDGETLGDILQITGYPEVSDGKKKALAKISYPDESGQDTWNELDNELESTVLENGMVIEFYTADRMVYVNGLVNLPGRYPFYPGKTVGEYLGMAGGYTRDADQKHVYLQDENRENQKVEYDRIVEPGDIIVIKQKSRFMEMLLSYTVGLASTAFVVFMNN